ncbi:MAG TPA: hypothetical protein VH189_11155 [Rhizomicrobium sp.]|jgi:hypothetical protein|nr:hypothetical protein [Rhizomicrobium sp.]
MSSSASVLEIVNAQTAAAKLHVLNLGPIKERLGEKWPKLSGLVHKLFETALREAQGPRDHFVLVDELSYVVTFHGLTFHEATVACIAVAQKVCEKLFGGTGTAVAVRALVGQLAEDVLALQFQDGRHIAAHLELNAREIVVKSDPSRKPPRVTSVRPGADDADWAPAETIGKARDGMAALGLEIGFFPIWELGKEKSSSLFASLYPRGATPKIGCTRQQLSSYPARLVDAEIAMLMIAHAYAHRLHQAGKVCALGAGVSFETLTGFHHRIRVITALKSLKIPPECRLLLKIEDVPQGTPLGKLAEMISMLAVPNIRFTVQFRNCQAVPSEVDIRLGAAGLGFALPHNYDAVLAAIFMKRLVHAFPAGFVFVEGLDTPELLTAAQACGVRFGTGFGLSRLCLSGEDKLPSFPLVQA